MSRKSSNSKVSTEVSTHPWSDQQLENWLGELGARNSTLAELLAAPIKSQQIRGYHHTIREICQQPLTWQETVCRVAESADGVRKVLDGCQAAVITGSGSSQYAGLCMELVLQCELAIPAKAIAGGDLLTLLQRGIPPARPCLMISLSRSGDSPESVGVVNWFVEHEPEVRHLILTCNPEGRLARRFQHLRGMTVIPLHDRVNDRSLVMTSSFTNFVLAGLVSGFLSRIDVLQSQVERLAEAAKYLLLNADSIASAAGRDFRKAVFLSGADRFGAAREAGLKLLEMTAGRIATLAETFLGVRHGPMCSIHDDTLVVCFLSSSALARAYETDVIRELNRKRLGAGKLIVGHAVPPDLSSSGDIVLEVPHLADIDDRFAPVLDTVVGQLLGLFRSLHEGLHPDSPSANGVISRVVEDFTLHR